MSEIEALMSRMSPAEMADMLALLDELEARKRQSLAQNDLLAFIAAVDPTYKFGVHLKRLGALLMGVETGEHDRIAVSMAPRFGKLLADDTPVWTPTGWRQHGDLQVGDFVYHPSGKPVRVVAVSDTGPADVRVEMTDGAVIYCHENHEWTVQHRANPGKWHTLETRELMQRSLSAGERGSRGFKVSYHLPTRSACEAPDADLPVHPYMLGVWLGDGTSTHPRITHAASDHLVIDRLVELGYPVSAVQIHATTGVHTTAFSVGSKGRGNGSPLLYALRALNVLGNKHIPVQYLTASAAQRLDLLAGLIDTDGTRDKTGRYSFTTVSERLADDVATLVRSLGWRAGIVQVEPRLSSSGVQGRQTYFMVSFSATSPIPVALERKAFVKAPAARKVGVAEITYDPQGKVGRCIQVDSPDGLYLAGDRFTPTHNSQMISIYYPAWYLGKHPDHKIIVASHTSDLAVDMARKVRNLMQTAEYKAVFPGLSIAADAKAAGKWNTNKGGEFYATGVGGALAGRGGHLIIVDDPLSEQDLKAGNTTSLDTTYEWFRSGLRTRLMPGGRLAILHTRWHMRDLIGRLVKDAAMNPEADQYEVFEFPAILNEDSDEPKSLWPEQWPLASLLRTKASMPAWQWNAQYQQNPTSQEAAVIKRDWIRWWPHNTPPECEFIVQAYDTALTTKERSDYSVCQTWGVFTDEQDGSTNVILLNRVKGKYEFPDLKQMALDQYLEWEPDSVIVETKASGQPLVDEMRRSGLFVQEFSPGKGQDKLARVNAVSDMFSAGHVWFPETRWATEVVEEILAFPAGEHDDECLVAGTMILMADGSQVAIETVRVGDMVATPIGPKRVVASVCTGVAPVRTVRGLTGTERHPVATGRGWVPLWELTPEDDIITASTIWSSSWPTLQSLGLSSCQSCSTGTSTTGTQNLPTTHTERTTHGQAAGYYTGQCGSSTTGLSQLDGTCTTKMATQKTTALRTWIASTLHRMPVSIRRLGGRLVTALSNLRTLQTTATKLLSGIGLRKGGHGTVSTQSTPLTKCMPQGTPPTGCTSTYAKPAAESLSGNRQKLNSVVPSAIEPIKTKYYGIADQKREWATSAPVVARSLLRRSSRKNTVQQSVDTLQITNVYNLSVECAECYYANDILVHNCDTMTLALIRIRSGGLLRIRTDHEDNEQLSAPIRSEYY